jgi:hypothetical protein
MQAYPFYTFPKETLDMKQAEMEVERVVVLTPVPIT